MRPILIQIGTIPIYSYGALVAIAFLVGLWAVTRRAKNLHLASVNQVIDLALWVLIGGIAGARLLFVLLELPTYIDNPLAVFALNQGGLSFYGSVIGGFIGGVIYAKRQSLPVWQLADIIAPWVAMGYYIVRIGCLLNGCCYGTQTTVSWALRCAAKDDHLRHPTQLYALIASLIIFFVLLYLEKRKPFNGFLFWTYIGTYSISRFIIEFYRDSQILAWGWLRTTQAACILLVLFSGCLIFLGYQRKGRAKNLAGEDSISARD